jgi:hypothetical protein
MNAIILGMMPSTFAVQLLISLAGIASASPRVSGGAYYLLEALNPPVTRRWDSGR